MKVGSHWQVAFHKVALYRFGGDKKKGQAKGQNVAGEWFAVLKSGIPASTAAGAASTSTASPSTTPTSSADSPTTQPVTPTTQAPRAVTPSTMAPAPAPATSPPAPPTTPTTTAGGGGVSF